MRGLRILGLCIILFSCRYTEKIKDGKTAFDRKQFAVAAGLLIAEYENAGNESRQELAYLLGESYTRLNRPEQALGWYQQAYKDGYGPNALLKLAFALKETEQYDAAAAQFEKLGEEIKDPQRFRKEITACKVSAGYKASADKNPYKLRQETFNSTESDFAPAVFREGRLVFTSDRGAVDPANTYKWTGRSFSRLYQTIANSGEVIPFDENFNKTGNTGTFIYREAGDEVIFTRCASDGESDGFCQLYSSSLENGLWRTPERLPFTEEGINYGHPALNAEGNILVFSSDAENGMGGYDLYAVERVDGRWGQPVALPAPINTSANEMFPFLEADTLYYSSDNTGGMGGLDIYSTYLNDTREWTPPQNLKAPVNSGADDFGWIVDRRLPLGEDLKAGYLSSSRSGGQGSDDIYQWRLSKPEVPPQIETPKDSMEFVYIMELVIQQKDLENPENPNSRVLRRSPLPDASYIVKSGKELIAEGKVGITGTVRIPLSPDRDYEVVGVKRGFLNNNAFLSTRNLKIDSTKLEQVQELKIALDKIYLNKEIVLKDIYYDYDKYNIREDAKVNLDELVKLLTLNQSIGIQLASHTDCRGSDAYNLDLSQKRAQSVVNYLISKGIDKSRLVPKGFGESKPAETCVCERCTEEQYQANRRTTFSILRAGNLLDN